MYYTLTIDGLDQLLEPHDSLAKAERFAREVAHDGFDCTVLQVLSFEPAEYEPVVSFEKYYGVEPGVDFPATLTRRAI